MSSERTEAGNIMDEQMKWKRWAFLAIGIVTLAGWLPGCGTDQAPVASDGTTVATAEDSRLLLVFSPGVPSAAKLAEEGRVVSAAFDAQGGQLKLKEHNGPGVRDDLRVKLQAGNGALSVPVTITMTTYGQTLSALVLEFAPGGLVFLDPAELTLDVGIDKVDLSLADLTVWHVHDDGTVEEAVVGLQKQELDDDELAESDEEDDDDSDDDADSDKDLVRIKIQIPGFSRFSMGGNP